MRLMEIALDCTRRGWYVFPCWPKSKKPMTERGFKDATLDEVQVREWWTKTPDANVAVATGPSGLCVVDVDHGVKDLPGVFAWLDAHGMPLTFAVRTGRRPEFGVQLYYSGEGLKSTGWRDGDISGDIRCSTGYVMAAGSIHPDSGEEYTVANYGGTNPVPEYVKTLTAKASDPSATVTVDDDTADDWKTWLLEYMDRNKIEPRDYEKRVSNGYWLGIHCPWESQHGSGAGAESSTVLGILDGKIAFECSHGTCKAAKHDTAAFKQLMALMHGEAEREPGAEPEIVLGSMAHLPMPKNAVPKNWRELFHTKDDVLNCPPPTFLIENFLACQAICAIAAPVGQRKSIIALNVARSLCTGEPLFGFLPVVTRPSRVLYLCPEMGLISLSDRVRKIGVGNCLGDTLFLRSMNLGGLDLLDLPDEALEGSVLIVDTAIRFMHGDENSAKDMKAFSDVLFDIQRRQGPKGAVIILYHSPKTTKDVFELTLENCLRGSGELGAAVTDAHGTRMQNPEDRWNSENFISHVKCRDYEGVEDFAVSCDRATGVLVRTGEVGVKAVLSGKRSGQKADVDGKDEAARAFIKARLKEQPDVTVNALIAGLADLGIVRKQTWVKMARLAIRGAGSKHTE